MRIQWLQLTALILGLWCVPGALMPALLHAIQEPLGDEAPGFLCSLQEELQKGFEWRVKILGYGLHQDPVRSPLNAMNALELEDYRAVLDFRPDLALNFRNVHLSVKPRLELDWKQWDALFEHQESEGDVDVLVNEWLARYEIREGLFVSYGRENLQWGPSILLSPSNPFNPDNGKNNPFLELPGMDYTRAVWVPSPSWSGSFIANLEDGEKDFFSGFHRQYAVKLDYTGQKKYFSLIPAYSESDDWQLGFFGGWSATDALMLYLEGSVREEKGLSCLIGGSFTLERGPTFSLEYFHSALGCSDAIQDCFPPRGDTSLDQVLFRSDYILAQLLFTKVLTDFNVVLRWIGELEDGSSRSVGILEYEMGNHTKLFTVGDYYTGNKSTEMGSLLAYSVMLGVEVSF